MSPTGSATRIVPARWRAFEACTLTDGRLEATVVPALGRLMSFRRHDGPELLWQMSEAEIARHPSPRTGWRNHGGDRTWLAPQDAWPALVGRAWPPDDAWGESHAPHALTEASGMRLRMAGPVSPASGLRLEHDYRFANGELLVTRRAIKVSGPPCRAALWSVTCAPTPREVRVPAPASSAYAAGWHLWPGARGAPKIVREGDHHVISPALGGGYKLGFDSPAATIAAVIATDTLVLRATAGPGDYPDGVDGPGFPVEFYTNGVTGDDATEEPFVELELLGPLQTLSTGQSTELTVHWDVRTRPETNRLRTPPAAPA